MKLVNLNRATSLGLIFIILSLLFVFGCQSATGPGAEPAVPGQGSEEKPRPEDRAAPQEPQISKPAMERSPEALAQRLKERGIEVVSHEDGTYEYQLPKGLENEEHWDGPLKYRYAGQATFGIPHRPGETVTFEWPETRDPDLLTQLRNTVKVDNYGRRWEVVEVNQDLATEMVAQYDAWATEAFGPERVKEPEPESSDGDIEPGTPVDVTLLSAWATANPPICANTNEAVFGTDNRTAFPQPVPSQRMDKAVAIFSWYTDWGGDSFASSCSGVLISDQSVLTAQHCVSRLDLIGRGWQEGFVHVFTPSENIVVCTRGNSDRYDPAGIECSEVDGIAVNGFKYYTNNIKHDYAVLQLSQPIGNQAMGLSRGSVSDHEPFPIFSSGYPGNYPGTCNSNGTAETSVLPLPSTVALAPLDARQGFWQGQGTVLGGNATLKTTLDSMSGQSGSAMYYYPGGCPGNCGSNWVVGVLSHITCKRGTLECYSGGPHIKKFRDWAIAVRR